MSIYKKSVLIILFSEILILLCYIGFSNAETCHYYFLYRINRWQDQTDKPIVSWSYSSGITANGGTAKDPNGLYWNYHYYKVVSDENGNFGTNQWTGAQEMPKVNAFNDVASSVPNYVYSSNFPLTCDDLPNCLDEIEQATQECNGLSNFNIDLETCSYTCLPCSGSGQTSLAEAQIICQEDGGLLYHDDTFCTYACKGQCENLEEEAITRCGALGIDYSSYDSVNCTVGCLGCGEAQYQAAIEDCEEAGSQLNEASYTCIEDPNKGVLTDYYCDGGAGGAPQLYPQLELEEPKQYIPMEPEEPATPAPNPTDTNPETNDKLAEQLLEGLKANSDTNVQQSEAEIAAMSNIAENLVKSMKNDSEIAKAQKERDEKMLEKQGGTTGKLQEVKYAIKDLNNTIDDIAKKGWDGSGGEFDVMENDGSLLSQEKQVFTDNVASLASEIENVTGIDFSGASGLPSWDVPLPIFGTLTIDLNVFKDAFDIIASITVPIAYFLAALILFT